MSVLNFIIGVLAIRKNLIEKDDLVFIMTLSIGMDMIWIPLFIVTVFK